MSNFIPTWKLKIQVSASSLPKYKGVVWFTWLHDCEAKFLHSSKTDAEIFNICNELKSSTFN